MAECILLKSGSNVDLDSITASANDVLKGKVTLDKEGEPLTGTMVDKSGTTQSASVSLDATNSQVQMTVPVTGKYSSSSKLYATYASIRNLISLTAAKIAIGNTILGLPGSYKGLGNATTENVLSGKKFSTADLSNASGTMPDKGAVSVSLSPGGSYIVPKGCHNGSGKVTAKSKYIKMIGVFAARGFGAPSADYDIGPFESSFILPVDGVVYYNGSSACYKGSGNVICEIYKNGIVVDQRNINSSNNFYWRGTMHEKSFSAAKGDTITVKAAVTSGSHALATVDAVIVYFS